MLTNKFIKIIMDKNHNIIKLVPYKKYYLKLFRFEIFKRFLKINHVFNKFNSLIKYRAKLLFNIKSKDFNCQLITTLNNKELKQYFIALDDTFLFNYNEIPFNYDDIYALIGHEFGHIYHRLNHYSDFPIWPRNKKWDDEFYADMYCTHFLQRLNIDKFALLKLHQKMLEHRYDDDTADLDHPSISDRIEMLQQNYYK